MNFMFLACFSTEKFLNGNNTCPINRSQTLVRCNNLKNTAVNQIAKFAKFHVNEFPGEFPVTQNRGRLYLTMEKYPLCEPVVAPVLHSSTLPHLFYTRYCLPDPPSLNQDFRYTHKFIVSSFSEAIN